MSIKTILLIVLITTSGNTVLAQQNETQRKIDSLTQALAGTIDATKKIRLLDGLTFAYHSTDPARGISYGQEAIRLAQNIISPAEMAIIYGDMATCYEFDGNYAMALDYRLRCLKQAEVDNNKKKVSHNLEKIGEIYNSMDNFNKALEYDSASLRIAKANGLEEQVNSTLLDMGVVFSHMNNYTESLRCYMSALAYGEKFHDNEITRAALVQIGLLYDNQGSYALALKSCTKALQMEREIGDDIGLALALKNISITYVEIAEQQDSIHIAADSLISPQKSVNLNRADSAISASLILSQKINDQTNIAYCYLVLSCIEEDGKNFKEALDYYKKYKSYYDSTNINDRKLAVATLETKRETGLKEQQIQANKLAISQKHKERYMYLAGIALLAVTITALFRDAKTQKRTNAVQADALMQKEVLMKELHHRVKNNLQVISTLLELQQENVTDKAAKDAINESASRLRSILLIHQQLYTGDQLTEVDCAHFAAELMAQVKAIFSHPGQHITFNNMQQVILDVDTSVQLGLMLNEMITNSFKYAFASADGTISLRIETAGHKHKLYYTDSGPGLPEDLDIYNTKTTGLGMMVLASLSRQLGGSFTYDRSNKTFIITFKDEEGNKRDRAA